MRDLWGFLLQTLTASGAAVLLLVVKAMFRDKLSPRWQFAVWGVLGLVLLMPAGAFGRYALIHWPLVVESLKTLLTGQYTLTSVAAPIPLPHLSAPETVTDWLFLAYLAGVAALLLRYIVSYARLRRALHRGASVENTAAERIRSVAERYDLPVCPAVRVPGLSSAFICGVIRPVLALPAGVETEEKVLLHELLHLKHRDAVWGLVICLLRSIHWCNPLLWYCADRAGNDLEARCDQRVLEHLEGEARRDYGRILLSMANEKYARVPGTSSMANGGKNIRRRVEAIARFKKYPRGMALVSACVVVTLAAPLVLGTPARSVYSEEGRFSGGKDIDISLASARTTWCTTPAGALDAYGKSLLTQNGIYRAMCAPMDQQAEIAARMHDQSHRDGHSAWDTGLPCQADKEYGYVIYNLEPVDKDAYEGLMVIALSDYPHARISEMNWNYLAVQTVHTKKEDGRWVVIPQGDFQVIKILGDPWLTWGCEALPAYVYADTAEDFRVELRLQKVFTVDNTIQETNDLSWVFGPTVRYDTLPKPDATFDQVHWNDILRCVYVGDEASKSGISSVGLSVAPLKKDGSRPELRGVANNSAGSSSDGSSWGGRSLEENWDPTVYITDGGTSDAFGKSSFNLPEGYVGQLYINQEPVAELTLRLREGGPQ